MNRHTRQPYKLSRPSDKPLPPDTRLDIYIYSIENQADYLDTI